jgi:hypothetical protein
VLSSAHKQSRFLSSHVLGALIAFAFSLTALVSQPANAGLLSFCEGWLIPKPIAKEVEGESLARLDELLGEIRSLGLNKILSSYEDKMVRVDVRARRSGSQSQIEWHNTRFGKRILTLRNLHWKSEEEKQLLRWKLADALYRLELDKRLLSLRSMILETGMEKGEQGWIKYLLTLPSRWKDARVLQMADLQADMYKLMENSPLLKADVIFPQEDPGKKWFRSLLLFGDSTTKIFPNQEDQKLFERLGESGLKQELSDRHSRWVRLNYYFDFAKRMAIATSVVSTLMVGQQLLELPNMYEAQITASNQGSNIGVSKEVQLQIVAERNRLEKARRAERSKIYPDTRVLDQIEGELRELNARYSWLLLIPFEGGKP